MKKNKFLKSLVVCFFKPSISAIDLMMLGLIIIIFNGFLFELALFFTWYVINKFQIVPNLGFEVFKRW